MDDGGGGSFVAVRRVAPRLEQGSVYHSSSSSAEVVAGSAAWLGRGLSCVCAPGTHADPRPSFDLTPAQEECLQKLQSRIDVAYDSSIPQHQEALKDLWKLAFPEEELHGIVSDQWKEMGWQGKDPSTDFRGGGFISLENLLYFAKNFPKSFHDLLRKKVGDRSVWEYPFAVAGINITFMLIQMLDLEAVKPRSIVGETFLRFLSVNESAFDLLYCIAFKQMDQQWLSMRASYMEFNKSFHDLLRKKVGDRSVWEYPFAVAGINITFMLIQMLGLESVKPQSVVGETFLRFLSVNESAFDLLYCIAFKLMDQQWLSMRASYMEFNTVMKSTRRQLEREIMVEDIRGIEDMPSYSLLSQSNK